MTPLARIDLICEQEELYTRQEIITTIRKIVAEGTVDVAQAAPGRAWSNRPACSFPGSASPLETVARAICEAEKMNPDDALGGWIHWKEAAAAAIAAMPGPAQDQLTRQPDLSDGERYSNVDIAMRMWETFNVCGDRWFKYAAQRLERSSGVAQRPAECRHPNKFGSGTCSADGSGSFAWHCQACGASGNDKWGPTLPSTHLCNGCLQPAVCNARGGCQGPVVTSTNDGSAP